MLGFFLLTRELLVQFPVTSTWFKFTLRLLQHSVFALIQDRLFFFLFKKKKE